MYFFVVGIGYFKVGMIPINDERVLGRRRELTGRWGV